MGRRAKRSREARARRGETGAAAARALAAGIAAHRAGRLDAAAARYLAVLAACPDHADAHHLLGLVRHQTGRGDEAVALISAAIRRAPREARYHGNLARVLHAQGRLDEAEAAARRALAIDPGHLEAHNNLAGILRARGRLDEAIETLRRALARAPDYAAGHNNLGNLLKERGDYPGAIAAYRRAVALAPDYADAHYNLSVALLARGALDAAQASVERALALRPRDAAGHNNLGNIQRFRGDLDAARASYRRAIALRPDFAAAYRNLAELETFAPDDPAFARLERIKNRPGPPDHETISAAFALARMYADAGDPARAFANWRAGNALRKREAARRGRSFDADAHDRFVDALIATFTPTHFARPAGIADGTGLVFVVGMPRSGTSLVEQILSSHRAVHGAGERAEIGRIAERVAHEAAAPYPAAVEALDAAALARHGRAYLEALRPLAPDALRMVDKMPSNVFHLGLIARILPGARVVHCRRDPRDVCLSCFAQDFAQGNEFSYDLGDLARYWRGYERLAAHWRRALPLETIELRYEALVADPEGESRRLVDFLGLDWDPACLDFHKTRRVVRTSSSVQVRRPVFADSVGRWRAFARELAPLLAALGDPSAA